MRAIGRPGHACLAGHGQPEWAATGLAWFAYALRVLALLAVLLPATTRGARAQLVDPVFPVVNGSVGALRLMGDTLVIGGHFHWAGPANGSCVALDAATGTPVAHWPRVPTGTTNFGLSHEYAEAVLPDGVGGCWVGGAFTNVAGVPRGGLAHIRADGTLDDWNPSVDGDVSCLAHIGSILYVGGSFTTLAGQPRSNLGAVDVVTGAAASWNPGADEWIQTMATDSATIYVGGNFSQAGGQPRSLLAALDPVTGAATSWNPGADSPVAALAVADSQLVVGGYFSSVGGQPRACLALVSTRTGVPVSPATDCDGPVYAISVDGGTLRVGGAFSTLGGQARPFLGELNLATHAVTSWNPQPSLPVHALALDAAHVYAGGEFGAVGATERLRVAAFDRASGALTAWNPGANEAVTALATWGNRVFACGRFSGCGGVLRSNLAAVDVSTGRLLDWAPVADNNVYALALTESTLVAGGAFVSVDGVPRGGLAQFVRGTGQLTPWSVPALTGSLGGPIARQGSTLYVAGTFGAVGTLPARQVTAIDLGTGQLMPWYAATSGGWYNNVSGVVAAGSRVFIGGDFTSVNGVARRSLASLDAQGGAVLPWDAQIAGNTNCIALQGSSIYAGGIFTPSGQNSTVLAAFDTATAACTASANSAPFTPWTMLAAGNALYLGSLTPGYIDVSESFASAVDPVSLSALPWQPYVYGGYTNEIAVFCLEAGGPDVFVGGDYFYAGPEYRGGLAHVIAADTDPPSVALMSPSPGQTVVRGSTRSIQWSASDAGGLASCDVSLSMVGPAGPWQLLAAGVSDTTAWDWTVPASATTGPAWLQIVARDWAGNSALAIGAGPIQIVDGATAVPPGRPDAAALALSAPTPNPASGPCALSFVVPHREAVRLSVLDVQGRERAVLASGMHEPGAFTVPLDTRGLRPGLYFARLRGEGGPVVSRRIVVVR